MTPQVFLGSSAESLPLAKSIQKGLNEVATVRRWDQDVFRPGDYPLERLIELVNTYDFAIFLIAPNDLAEIRGQRVLIARDNVLFEAGLFFSQLGRKRTFLVAPVTSPSGELAFHLPSDLNGLTRIKYFPPDNPDHLQAKLGAACSDIEEAFQREGLRAMKEALRNLDKLSGGPIFLLRHLERRPQDFAHLACILKYFNNAERDASVGWKKAASYACQALTLLGLAALRSDGGGAYITDAGEEFLNCPKVKERFSYEFEKPLYR
jgi:hypothetical protein